MGRSYPFSRGTSDLVLEASQADLPLASHASLGSCVPVALSKRRRRDLPEQMLGPSEECVRKLGCGMLTLCYGMVALWFELVHCLHALH